MDEPEGSALTLYGVFILFYRILKLDSVRTVIMDRLSIYSHRDKNVPLVYVGM